MPAVLLVPLTIELARHAAVSAGLVDPLPAAIGAGAVMTALGVLLIFLASRQVDRFERTLKGAINSNLLSMVAHELRAPLAAMRNLADVVDTAWDELSEEQKRGALRTTAEETARLLDLMHDLAQLARLESGGLPARPEAVVLCDALLDAVAGDTREVAVRCPPTIVVLVDPEHLRLMLGACLSPAGGSAPGTVRIDAAARGSAAILHVRLPVPADLDDGRRNTRRASPWTVAELARLSKGDASFERIDETSCRFVLTLPLAVSVPTTEPGV